MRVGTRIVLAAGLIGAAAIGSTAVVNAQYYYPPPGYGPPPPYGYGYGIAGELGTAARRAIRCKAVSVSPIAVPPAADGALGTVVRPAIRSRVANASRIAATRPLKSLPTVAAPGGAQIKETLLKGTLQNSRRDFATRSSRADRLSTVGLQLGWPLSGAC